MANAAQIIPDEHTRQAAELASRALAPLLTARGDTKAVFTLAKNRSKHIETVLPPDAVLLLVRALAQLARGRIVTLVPMNAELTTQQAADVLNVSRPFLVGLLEKNAIPYRKVGNRRRILAEDLLKYRDRMASHALRAAADLTQEAEALGLEY